MEQQAFQAAAFAVDWLAPPGKSGRQSNTEMTAERKVSLAPPKECVYRSFNSLLGVGNVIAKRAYFGDTRTLVTSPVSFLINILAFPPIQLVFVKTSQVLHLVITTTGACSRQGTLSLSHSALAIAIASALVIFGANVLTLNQFQRFIFYLSQFASTFAPYQTPAAVRPPSISKSKLKPR
jgi:hypothetical protein